MPFTDLTDFFDTLPKHVSFPLKLRSRRPSVLCWFNPECDEFLLPNPVDALKTFWRATEGEISVYEPSDKFDEFWFDSIGEKITRLEEDDVESDDDLEFVFDLAIGQDSVTGGVLFGILPEIKNSLFIGSASKSQMRDRISSACLLSDILGIQPENPNFYGRLSFIPSKRRDKPLPYPWSGEFLVANSASELKEKAASFLPFCRQASEIWSICAHVINDQAEATAFGKVRRTGHKGKADPLYQATLEITRFLEPIAPYHCFIFWRD